MSKIEIEKGLFWRYRKGVDTCVTARVGRFTVPLWPPSYVLYWLRTVK